MCLSLYMTSTVLPSNSSTNAYMSNSVLCAGITHIYVLWKHPGHSNRRAFKNTIFICCFVNEDRLHVTVHSFHYITMVLIFGYVHNEM